MPTKEELIEKIKESLKHNIDELALDRRNAIEVGADPEEIDTYITETARELIAKYDDMTRKELASVMEKRVLFALLEMHGDDILESIEKGEL